MIKCVNYDCPFYNLCKELKMENENCKYFKKDNETVKTITVLEENFDEAIEILKKKNLLYEA